MSEEKKVTVDQKLIQQLLQMQVDTITERPCTFKIKVDDDSMIPEGKKIESITITPLKVRTVAEITPLLLKIDKEDLDKITANRTRDFDTSAPEIFNKYQKAILDIICIGIRNKKGDSPPWFKEFLECNFTWKELLTFLNAIAFRMQYDSFQSSIIQLSEMSPIDDRGIIALQKNLQTNMEKKKEILTQSSSTSTE